MHRETAARIVAARVGNTFLDIQKGDKIVKGIVSLDDVNKVNRELIELGKGNRVGWKVGMNNPPEAFKSAGFNEPFTAPLMKEGLRDSGASLTARYVTEPGTAEAEWGFVIKKDLPHAKGTPEPEDIENCISDLFCSIEMIGSCMSGPEATFVHKISDHGASANVIMKPVPSVEFPSEYASSLASSEVTLKVNGTAVTSPGTLDPLRELHRLVRLVHAKGHDVSAGDIMITGAVVKHVGLSNGDVITACFDLPDGTTTEVTCRIDNGASPSKI